MVFFNTFVQLKYIEMNNNDIIRRLRFTFNIGDSEMMAIFKSGGQEVNRSEISDWLKKDDDPEQQQLLDKQMAVFLNGFINNKRGKREGEQPKPEKRLNNNIIFRKLKIALNLKDEDILEILMLADFRLSKHELSAFFRKPTQNQFRKCKDQVLRNFIHGLQVRYRPNN